MTQEPQPLRPPTERPVYKLSVDLLSTYKHINQIFYEAKRKKQALEKGDKKAIYNDGYDDDSGNYVVQIGEEIAGRYIVQEVLGKGSFGVVVKAHDHRRDECVAVKIINKVQFFHQAKVEIEILTKLNTISSEEHNIVKLKKVFSWKDHLCLVFELLSFNLYDLLKYTKFNGVSLNLIRKFASQILKTLDFLSSQNVKVIHCDLKPEKILLKNPKRSGVKVIDFGSSCFLHKKMFKYIQSRFYRSPEVIWGLNYDCAIDMWSLACILVEMHTGLPLFDGKDEAEQLLKFQNVLGPSPNTLVELSPKRTKFYTLNPTNKTWVINQVAKSQQPLKPTSLEEIIGVHTGGPHGRRRGQAGHSDQDYACFLDLIKKMLQYNPKQRITPSAALQHPFLSLPDDPSLTIPPQIPTQTQSQPQQQQQQQSGFGHYPVQNTVDSSQQGMAGVSPRQYPQNQLPAGVSGLSPVITQLVGSHPVLGENNALTSIATQPMGTAASPPLAIQQAFQQAQLGGAQLAQLQLQAQLPFVHQAQQQYLASLLAQAQAAHCLIPSQAPLQQAQTQPQTQPQTHHNIVTSGPNAGKESDKKTGSTPTKLHSNYAVGCPEPVVLS